MKAKKSKHANVDRLRGLFFRIGLILSILLVIFAFNWRSETKKQNLSSTLIEPIAEELPPITIIKQPQKRVQSFKVKIIDNNSPEPADSTDMLKTEVGLGDSLALPPVLIDSMKVDIDSTPLVIVEDMPEFPGGEAALFRFLAENIQYPQMELQNGIQGLVILSFVVEKDGSLSNVKVLKGITPNLNNESIRVVGQMPKWKPGKQRKKPVRVNINLPIRYTIN